MNPRFIVGDIIHITKYWDYGEWRFLDGIVEIIEYSPHYTNTLNGIYVIKVLKGSIGWTTYNSSMFDTLPYLVWLGNINDNLALKLLYGKV